MQHRRITPLVLAILTVACVYTPESGGEFNPSEPVNFRGLASQPGAEIQLLGFNKSSGQWIELTQTTADATPQDFHEDRELYNWQLGLRLDERDDWRCFLSTTCELDREGSYEASFRVREVDGLAAYLFTFDVGGFECWWNRYLEGEDLLSAYWPCRAESSDEIRLSAPIVL
jgi:hypothetical protein